MSKTLKLGQNIPDITLKDQTGETLSLTEAAKKGALVVYFYPKDDTPGCTAQACSFRDHFEDFTDIGAQVIGISGDSVASHKKFAERHKLKFPLLSDPKREAEKAFGVPRNLFGLLPGRVTYIFDNQGKLIKEFNSATMISKHIKESIIALESNS